MEDDDWTMKLISTYVRNEQSLSKSGNMVHAESLLGSSASTLTLSHGQEDLQGHDHHMDANHSYGESPVDGDGLGDKHGCGESMVATMLSDDLLHLVFSFLDQKSLCVSAMVCRQWHVVSAHEDLWKCLSFEGLLVTKEKVGQLCRRYSKAVKVTVKGVPWIEDVLREAILSLRCLRSLYLSEGFLADSTFTTLEAGCLDLQQLTITDAFLFTKCFEEFLVRHERLQELQIIYCQVKRKGNRLADLTILCPGLVNVSVSNCLFLRQVNVSCLVLKGLVLHNLTTLTKMSLQCPCLLKADLSGCILLPNSICEFFSDGGVCPRLTSLILDNCESLTAVHLSSSSLEFLSLAGCNHIYSLELACTKLQFLNLKRCGDLRRAILAPVALESLNLGICPGIMHLKLEAPSMTFLDLKGCGALSEAYIFCPQLLSLDAFYCSRLEDECLEAIATSSPLLQSLILASCPSIGPAGLSALRKLSNLTILDLSYTSLSCLSLILENCPHLKTLKLLACKNLVDTALDSLHSKNTLPELRELDLSYGSLEQTTLDGLLSQCIHLTHVNINGCTNVRDLDFESKRPPQKLLMSSIGEMLEGAYDPQLVYHGGKSEKHHKENRHWHELNDHTLNFGETVMPLVEESAWSSDKKCEELERMPQGGVFISPHALQFLNCVGCSNLRNVVITQSAGFWNLVALNFSLGCNITHVRLECAHLSSLNLSNCTALKVADIKCPQLVSLWLQASNIDEAMLEGVLQGCPSLETLDIRDCSKLTKVNNVLLPHVCPRLKQLLNGASRTRSRCF